MNPDSLSCITSHSNLDPQIGTSEHSQAPKILRPTIEAYNAHENAFDFFNNNLFVRLYGTLLPSVMLTMPKHARFQGYFLGKSWGHAQDKDAKASEIALNPRFFSSSLEVCQTLVHEMAHHAQAEMPKIFGKPGARGYHNKNFARLMIRLGLMPSSTGKPGGKQTGNSMSDYPIPGGPFLQSYDTFIASGFEINWRALCPQQGSGGALDGSDEMSAEDQLSDTKRRSKTKYSCSGCGLNAWAKPDVSLTCGSCVRPLIPVSS